MRLQRYGSSREFLERARPFLLAREAEHNLILGICANLVAEVPPATPDCYFATVEEGGAIVGAALRTPPHNLVLSRLESPEALEAVAQDALAVYGTLPGVHASKPLAETFARRWQELTGQEPYLHMAMRIYQLDAVTPPRAVSGRFRPAAEADRPFLREWVLDFSQAVGDEHGAARVEELLEGYLSRKARGLFLWEDGQPVSMAGYGGPTPSGVRVSAVYTPPEHRRRGYASACVAALSQHLLDSGRRFCFLYTDLGNPISNHIYQEIGYRPVCDVDVYKFR